MRSLSFFSAMATTLMLGGCAVLAGYDFGSYQASTGSGGSTTTGTLSGPSSGGSSSTNGTQSGGGAVGGSGGMAGAGGSGAGGSGTGAGGAGTGGGGPLTLFSDPNDVPTSIALDSTSVYFTTATASGDPSVPTGTVRRVDKNGANPTMLGSKVFAPFSCVLDSSKVYWGAQAANTSSISRMAKTLLGSVDPLTSTGDSIGGLAVQNNQLFWTLEVAGQVWSAATNGSGPTKISTTTTTPSAMASDADGIYWLGAGGVTTQDSEVLRADFNGGNKTQLATGQDRVLAIALDATRVYWTTLYGGLASTLKDGTGTPFFNVTSGGGSPITGLAVDGGTIYFAQDHFVMSVPILGTSPTPLVTEMIGEQVLYIAVDSTSIYYTVSGTPNTVVKISR